MSVLDAIAKQYEGSKSGSGTSYEQDFSKYFAVRLEEGVNNGESTIRVMPPKQGTHPVNKDGDTPFDEGHWHSVKVGGKWRKIYCRKNNDGEHCPLCEVSADLFKSWKETGNKSDKDLATQYSAKKFYLARVIDRSKEDDGVKFWRFPHNYKGEGILDKIIPLFTKKGDITDPKSSKAKEWMSEETSWKDIYKAQPLDYVQLIADGETPAWDKNLNKFIAKGEEGEAEASFKQESVEVETTPNNSSEKNDEEPF